MVSRIDDRLLLSIKPMGARTTAPWLCVWPSVPYPLVFTVSLLLRSNAPTSVRECPLVYASAPSNLSLVLLVYSVASFRRRASVVARLPCHVHPRQHVPRPPHLCKPPVSVHRERCHRQMGVPGQVEGYYRRARKEG